MSDQATTTGRSPFLPLLLLGLALLAMLAMQAYLLASERQVLTERIGLQAQPLANGHKLRTAADSLFGKMQALSDKGNPNARAVVTELQKRGLTINPDAKTPEPPQ